MTSSILTRIAAALLFCAAANAQAGEPATGANLRVALNIKAQPVREALQAFGEQTGLQVLFRSEGMSLEGVKASPASGELSAAEGLTKMLASTGLKYEFVNERTVRVSAAGAESSKADIAAEESKRPLGVTRGRAGSPQAAEKDSPGETSSSQQGTRQEPASLEEVVVTGTHIRNAGPAGSPIHTYDRRDIERSAITSTAQLIALIPQHFGGGISETTSATFVPADGRTNANSTLGTGVNLRGLGSDATLVLVNGHRLTQTGAGDLSIFPKFPFLQLSASMF